jgi:putative alpha-1,2-mannosidase
MSHCRSVKDDNDVDAPPSSAQSFDPIPDAKSSPLAGTLAATVAGALVVALAPVAAQAATSPAPVVADPAALANPMVGTGSGGAVVGQVDTFPGADMPFGMVQWSPDTPSRPDGGGYNIADHSITGFSLTHLSGPGCAIAGDFTPSPSVSGTVQRAPEPASNTKARRAIAPARGRNTATRN